MKLDRSDFLKITGGGTLGGLVSAVAPAAAADDPRVVRVLTTPADAAKQVLYAQRANLFRKRGIQAEITPMGSGAAIIAAVVGGSAEFGSGSLFPVFSAFGHNIPIRIVAPISIYTSDACDTFLLVSKDSPIRTPRDLNGKIMGADAPNDIYITSTRLWLDQHGGDGNSIRAVELKAGEQLATLDQGRIEYGRAQTAVLNNCNRVRQGTRFGETARRDRAALSCLVLGRDGRVYREEPGYRECLRCRRDRGRTIYKYPSTGNSGSRGRFHRPRSRSARARRSNGDRRVDHPSRGSKAA
jgi:hypothetical protein